MRIRRLARGDAPAYRNLMLEAYAAHPEAFTASVEEREVLPLAWWERRASGDDDAEEITLGAFDDGGQLVGVAGLRTMKRPKTRHKADLYGMYVQAGHTGRGIGRALVDAVLDEARARAGLRIVQLTVTEGNREARSLYERCGFVSFGVEPYAIAVDGGHAAKVHMWLDLEATRPDA